MPKFGALDNSITGSHTEQEWCDLLDQWNWLCFYCGEPVRKNSPDADHEATKDHMVPISRGGVDFIGNIVPACLRCNLLKGNKNVEEFRSQRAWVLDRKSTGNTLCPAKTLYPQAEAVASFSGTVEILAPAPPLPTIEIAAMWKRVVDTAARQKTIDDRGPDSLWQQRRATIKAQAERMMRDRYRQTLEAAGQMRLSFDKPKPMVGVALETTEPQSLVVSKGMHVVDSRRQA